MATLYTPPGGYSPAATQLAQGNAQAAAATPVPVEASAPQLGQASVNATQQLAAIQTPANRAQYLQNSDIPAMQTNYDDLARQLFQYDKMNLMPEYGNNPGIPSDALSYGRVPQSQIQQLTPTAAANPTLFADNPKYGITAQATGANTILDVLDSLNSAISKEFSARRGQYASTVQSQKDILNTISDLIKTKNEKEYNDKRLQLDKYIADIQFGRVRDYHFQDMAQQVRTEIQNGTYTSADEPVKTLKSLFPDYSEAQIRQALGNPSQEQIDTALKLKKTARLQTVNIPGLFGTSIGRKVQLVDPFTGEAQDVGSSGNQRQGEMHVRKVDDGQTGYIPVSEYDPKLYVPIQ